VTRYCVLLVAGQWRLAVLTGTAKDVQPGSFAKVRDAIAESVALNAAQDAVWAAQTAAVAAEAA
jgi:hypothetical protein